MIKGDWAREAVAVMVSQGKTIDDLSKEIGLSKRYTSTVLRGRYCSDTARKSIEKALGMDTKKGEGKHD